MIEPILFACAVARIIDGDGIACLDGQRIRLAGINARERDGTCRRSAPCPPASAQAATDTLRRLVEGQTLQCRPTGTTYGRVAAFCVTESGVDISCELVRAGVAARWDRYDPEGRLVRC